MQLGFCSETNHDRTRIHALTWVLSGLLHFVRHPCLCAALGEVVQTVSCDGIRQPAQQHVTFFFFFCPAALPSRNFRPSHASRRVVYTTGGAKHTVFARDSKVRREGEHAAGRGKTKIIPPRLVFVLVGKGGYVQRGTVWSPIRCAWRISLQLPSVCIALGTHHPARPAPEIHTAAPGNPSSIPPVSVPLCIP